MADESSQRKTPTLLLFILFLFLSSSLSTVWALNNTTSSSSIRSFCKPTPFPEACFSSLKLSISININPNIITFLLLSLESAVSEAAKLSNLLSSIHIGTGEIVEKQRGAVQDCKELHQITASSLQRSISRIRSRKLADARAYLTAALTNKNTCLEGLDSASGPLKPVLENSLALTYKHISNSLSILSRKARPNNRRRRLLGLPEWVARRHRRILQRSSGGGGEDYDAGLVLSVAADGSGNFTTVTEAINYAPNNSYDRRTFVHVKEGVYEENVEIPSYKPNIVLIGDGTDLTFITSNRSRMDGWTTFRSATLAVSGEGFLARDITFENTAGPAKQQAVALRVNADMAAVYRCVIDGYQDTLYAHSFRQFYRECDVYGTIDFIFGNAAAVFQACNIAVKAPLPGQFTVVTAQSRDSEDEDTGFSMQNCSVVAADDDMKASNPGSNRRTYLGRPWRAYSRVVYIESYIGEMIDPTGWVEWDPDDEGTLETLYYGEFGNLGPGSGTDDRVDWPGYHVMDYEAAADFTVLEFIAAEEWLDSTSFPYDNGI